MSNPRDDRRTPLDDDRQRPHADNRPEGDKVELASEDSFPASDPPSWNSISQVGPPGDQRPELERSEVEDDSGR